MTPNPKPLDTKTALVTGGTRRIGRTICLELAARGARVVVNARKDRVGAERVVSEIKAAGGSAISAIGDITNEGAVAAITDKAVSSFGKLDCLIHNAVARADAPLAELNTEDWRRTLSVTLDGAMLCAKHCEPHLRAGKGRIVFIGGATASHGGITPATPTAKAGLIGLARTLARTMGPDGVTVNVLSLGSIVDDADDAASRARLKAARPSQMIALQRLGTSWDVARAVAALCGDDFAYLTGQVLELTGGFNMR